MTKQEAIDELHKHYVPEYVNYIVTALTDGATPSDAPTLKQEPKTGHWVKKSQYGNDYCSECDYELLMYENPKYCPNCGAEMSESKFFAKVAESYCKGLRDGLTVESEDKEGANDKKI